MTVGVLATCHTQYTWDRSTCIFFLFNRTTLQVFVTYLTVSLYVHPLWFYKYQHENRVRSKLFVACQHAAFSLPFAAILVNCAPSGEMHNYCTPHVIKENYENFLIHRCNYILLSQVYCVWQVVKTPTIVLNNPVFPVYNVYKNVLSVYFLSFNQMTCNIITIEAYIKVYKISKWNQDVLQSEHSVHSAAVTTGAAPSWTWLSTSMI